jgi:two-component system, chemotaxis family, response regulator PixG
MRIIQRSSLPSLFAKLASQKVTGKLVVSQPEGESSFYFISGRFLFAVHEVGRVRRWYRAAERFCPDLKTAVLQEPHAQIPWEYQLLCQELTNKRMSQQQARSILVAMAQEVVFPLLWADQVSCSWLPMALKTSLLAWIPFDKEILHPIQTLTMQVLHQGTSLVKQLEQAFVWKGPDTDGMPDAAQELVGYLDGRYSFWDLTVQTEFSVIQILRHLDKLAHQQSQAFPLLLWALLPQSQSPQAL